MKVSNISFRIALCVAILGFSISCGNTDPEPNPSIVAADNWTDLPHGVKVYVTRQTCIGGISSKSNLKVDFKDAQLADGVPPESISNRLASIKCNEEDCNQYEISPGNQASFFHHPDGGLPYAQFFDITDQNFEVELTTTVETPDDQGNTQLIPMIDSAIKINFPNTVCGDGGKAHCEGFNPCVDAPESHTCIFNYERCVLESSECAPGYESQLIENQDGRIFNGQRCAEASSN